MKNFLAKSLCFSRVVSAGFSLYITQNNKVISTLTLNNVEALSDPESGGSETGKARGYDADCPVYEIKYNEKGEIYFSATGAYTKGHGNTCEGTSGTCTPKNACIKI